MTGQQQQQPQSQFNSRADNAALALRQGLQQQGAQIPDSRAVVVDADGKPPAPPPPEGSYQRMALDQQRAQQQQMQQQQPQPIGDQPPAGTPEQMVDGSQAPPLTPPGQPPQDTHAEQPQELSANAQKRIGDLVAQLRQKDQELQQALTAAKQDHDSLEDFKARFTALEEQHNQMIQSNLDNLDPETRLAVMQSAQINEAVHGIERRIMDQIMPHVTGLQQQNTHMEMMRLGEKYPAFDIQIHGPLIDSFRAKNSHCSVEQAYRAIAEGDEAVPRVAASAYAVPPVIPPGDGPPAPRYVPEPQPQSDPQQELVEEAQRVKQLMSSTDPADHRQGLRLADQNIARRLGNLLPGS